MCHAEAGALVVSSVDGDYLRTPFTKAGWGLFDYNVVVGDTEAPTTRFHPDWQLVEGASITAAAAVSPSTPSPFPPMFCSLGGALKGLANLLHWRITWQ